MGRWLLVLALALGGAAASPADPRPPQLKDVLRRAAERTTSLEEQLAVTVAHEDYSQALLLDTDTSPMSVRRRLSSDVAWVPTGDPLVWAFFRDVLTVDGARVADREGRLQQLFSGGPTAEARELAERLLEESVRYNLGIHRTVNTPTMALSLLHPRNQPRFRFHDGGLVDRNGVRVVEVRFAETHRPTLTRTPAGQDVRAHGVLWVEPARGDLVASELRLDLPEHVPAEIDVDDRLVERLGAWLPSQMREVFGSTSRRAGEQRLEATATYTDYRRAVVEVQPIQPVR